MNASKDVFEGGKVVGQLASLQESRDRSDCLMKRCRACRHIALNHIHALEFFHEVAQLGVIHDGSCSRELIGVHEVVVVHDSGGTVR